LSHPLDKGKSRFRTLVDGVLEAKPRLPLVHSTDTYFLEDILEDEEIRPQPCGVFEGQQLTYFFHARPSFRPNSNAEPTGLSHYFPVCLIFRPGWTTKIRRIFPFDSGAFQNGFYGAYLHRRMKLGDFGLEPDMSTPGKLISQFFGSVPSYLIGKSALGAKLDPAQFEALSYSALVNSKESNAVDSRGSSIELQTEEVVPIKDAIAAAVVPSTFAVGNTGQALKSRGIDVLPYRVFERMKPGEYMSDLTSLCIDYYVRIKLINESDL
jgi:hypothetical protein